MAMMAMSKNPYFRSMPVVQRVDKLRQARKILYKYYGITNKKLKKLIKISKREGVKIEELKNL